MMHRLKQKTACSFVTYHTTRGYAMCERSTIRCYAKPKLCNDNDKTQGYETHVCLLCFGTVIASLSVAVATYDLVDSLSCLRTLHCLLTVYATNTELSSRPTVHAFPLALSDASASGSQRDSTPHIR
jgi:hypothetical protein